MVSRAQGGGDRGFARGEAYPEFGDDSDAGVGAVGDT